MELFLKYILPPLIIILIAVIYFLWINGRNSSGSQKQTDTTEIKNDEWKRSIPKQAPIVPYMDSKVLRFFEILKMALPAGFTVIPHCPIEKLFDVSKRNDLRMGGQYADFVIFNDTYMPVLVIDLFDMSIVNLDTVNKIKGIFKDVLRASGVPVMDCKLETEYNSDMLRRNIANTINPLNKK